MTYNCADHPYHILAKRLSKQSTKMFGNRFTDVDSTHIVTIEMRQQLVANTRELLDKDRLEIMNLVRLKCPEAIYDYSDEHSSFSVDALNIREFLQIDAKVRCRLLNL